MMVALTNELLCLHWIMEKLMCDPLIAAIVIFLEHFQMHRMKFKIFRVPVADSLSVELKTPWRFNVGRLISRNVKTL